MHLQFTNLEINIPDWLLILLMALLLIQTVLSLISSYYSLKLAKLKRQKAEADHA